MIKIVALEGNRQKLDGGAMFGHAPRALWSKWHDADDLGRIELACRSFLVTGEASGPTLIDTGAGACFSETLRDRYGITPPDRNYLPESLQTHGLSTEDITQVILSHIHFDHAGGAIARADDTCSLTFPNATHIVSTSAWQRAQKPMRRDAASFQPEVLATLTASGKLKLIDDPPDCASHTYEPSKKKQEVKDSKSNADSTAVGHRCIEYMSATGHTPGMLLPTISGYSNKGDPVTAIYCADLIPGKAWLSPAIAMGYDRYPEKTCDEKEALYTYFAAQQYINDKHAHYLLFAHDPTMAIAQVVFDTGLPVITESRDSLTLHRQRP